MKEFEPVDPEELISFLIKAKKEGYASGERTIIKEEDGSYSTKFEMGDFKFHDNWFGGEPFAGREIVWYKGKAVWMMVYFGEDLGKAEGTIQFLQKALSEMSKEMPARGPKRLEEENFVYRNYWVGDIFKFEGRELIQSNGQEVYEASYRGGLVDQKKD